MFFLSIQVTGHIKSVAINALRPAPALNGIFPNYLWRPLMSLPTMLLLHCEDRSLSLQLVCPLYKMRFIPLDFSKHNFPLSTRLPTPPSTRLTASPIVNMNANTSTEPVSVVPGQVDSENGVITDPYDPLYILTTKTRGNKEELTGLTTHSRLLYLSVI